MAISKNDFLSILPDNDVQDGEEFFYYHNLCNELLLLWERSGYLKDVPEETRNEVVLCTVGYFMDICSDTGLWRAFTLGCEHFYGRHLPFYDIPEDYIQDELNPVDVRFIVWYSLAICSTGRYHEVSPENEEVMRLADVIAFRLDECYEEAPSLEDFLPSRGLEMTDPDDSKAIMELGAWVYWRSYLLRPTLKSNINDMLQGVDRSNKEEVVRRMNEAMSEFPSGPLALYLSEWMSLMLHGKLPEKPHNPASKEPHAYYVKFVEATNGRRLIFFDNYADMNRFFIEKMGWEKGIEHLAALKNDHDFALFVNPEKGMLVARNVARCIAQPGNSLYSKEYARENAIRFLTLRGRCPGDLLRFVCAMDWLPDAHFPGDDNHAIVAENHDFISRCYLQLYYRD